MKRRGFLEMVSLGLTGLGLTTPLMSWALPEPKTEDRDQSSSQSDEPLKRGRRQKPPTPEPERSSKQYSKDRFQRDRRRSRRSNSRRRSAAPQPVNTTGNKRFGKPKEKVVFNLVNPNPEDTRPDAE